VKYQGEIYADRRGAFRWRVRAPSGRIVVDSDRRYDDVDTCARTFAMLCRLAEVEHLVELPATRGWTS
jgi:uncharacterized protein YegP (UPF0339 family)